MCDVTLLSGCGQFLLPAYRGFFQCFLKVILIGSFKNLMFVILQRRSGLVPKKKKQSGNFVLKIQVFCTSTPWLRPSEKVGVLNIDFFFVVRLVRVLNRK